MLALASGNSWGAVTPGDYLAQIGSAQGLVTRCASQAALCEPGAVPPDLQVEIPASGSDPGRSFAVHWQWLRQAVTTSRTSSAERRDQAMRSAGVRLREEADEATQPSQSEREFHRARAQSQAVLLRPEFRTSSDSTWLQRMLERVAGWVFRLLSGMDRVGRQAPWLAPLVEWTCFLLAAAGLVWWLRRGFVRKGLRLSLEAREGMDFRTARPAADWAADAAAAAASGLWREAVHCLFWAGITLLDARRAWRPDPARTPRESLRLLRRGSEAWDALRELILALERTWYGAAEAGEGDYQQALKAFQRLEGARVERTTEPAAVAKSRLAAGEAP